MNVTSKRQMYALLAGGAFGNTTPFWESVEAWQNEGASLSRLWGLRSLRPDDRRSFLNLPAECVAEATKSFQGGFTISPMVDAWMVFRCEVLDSPGGLRVFGTENRSLPWKEAFRHAAHEWSGLRARVMLARYLNASSLADLWAVLDAFPGHVAELTALSRCFGTVPGRNAVIWEVRCATGEYERGTWGN